MNRWFRIGTIVIMVLTSVILMRICYILLQHDFFTPQVIIINPDNNDIETNL
jgi:hypothetical protein